MSPRPGVGALLCALGWLGCPSNPGPSAPAAAAAPPTSGYTAGPVSGGGAIRGSVTLAGTKPSLPQVRCARDADICGRARPNQSLLVGPGNGIKNVIVSLTDIHAGKAAARTQAKVDIVKCAYVPKVQAVDVKNSVMVTNQDLIPHDFAGSLGERSVFSRTILGKSEIVDLYTPGILAIGCDMHSGPGAAAACETGAIGVMPNPYFAVTGDDGSFTISEIPPGTYTVQAWHETLGDQSQRVTVAAGETAVADFKLGAK